MRSETIQKAIAELKGIYGPSVVQAQEGQRVLVKIPEVELYSGCKPATTPMMLVFDPNQPKPVPHVQVGQTLSNGRAPRSTSTVLLGGQSWLQFSFNIPWKEGDSIIRFVGSARQRFSQND